ncbi:hypothetical protein, partial [Micromonospora sp. CP22]|uniref:hypothetical protein n=1 Tax=Micromonospora sp. CP22 TaxID=2580517 RepID=UPI001E3CC6FE
FFAVAFFAGAVFFAVAFFAGAVFFATAFLAGAVFLAGAFAAVPRPDAAFAAVRFAAILGRVGAEVIPGAGAFVGAVFADTVFFAGAAFLAAAVFRANTALDPDAAAVLFADEVRPVPPVALRVAGAVPGARRVDGVRAMPAVRSVAAVFLAGVRFATGRVACCASAISVPFMGTCCRTRGARKASAREASRAVYLSSPVQRASSASHASLRSRTCCRAFSASAAEPYGPRTCRAGHTSAPVSTRWCRVHQ